MAEEASMHPDYSSWCKGTALADDPAKLRLRWNGTQTLVAGATGELVEGLLRLSFRTKATPSAGALALIREAFTDADATFETFGNERELEILAGATLGAVLSAEKPTSGHAALLATTTFCAGARKSKLPYDLARLAENTLTSLSRQRRKRPDVKKTVTLPVVTFDKSMEKIRQNWNQESAAEAFRLAAEAVQATLAPLNKAVSAMASLTQYVAIQDEELQILWWLTGGVSTSQRKPFDSLSVSSRPVILAIELARMTTVVPGPTSIGALMRRAGVPGKGKTTIPDAVNACPEELLVTVVENQEPSPATAPLHFAVKRKLETGDDATWVANWSAASGIAKDFALSPELIGLHFYREHLALAENKASRGG